MPGVQIPHALFYTLSAYQQFNTSTSLLERQRSNQLGQRKLGQPVCCGTHTFKNELRLYCSSSENALLNIVAYLQQEYRLHTSCQVTHSIINDDFLSHALIAVQIQASLRRLSSRQACSDHVLTVFQAAQVQG